MTTKSKSLAKKISEYEAEKELGKAAYKRSDRLLQEIVAEAGVGKTVEMRDGTRRRIADRFATRSTVFQPCGVRRYEIEEC